VPGGSTPGPKGLRWVSDCARWAVEVDIEQIPLLAALLHRSTFSASCAPRSRHRIRNAARSFASPRPPWPPLCAVAGWPTSLSCFCPSVRRLRRRLFGISIWVGSSPTRMARSIGLRSALTDSGHCPCSRPPLETGWSSMCTTTLEMRARVYIFMASSRRAQTTWTGPSA